MEPLIPALLHKHLGTVRRAFPKTANNANKNHIVFLNTPPALCARPPKLMITKNNNRAVL